jgi:N-acetylglucosamine kinase-like BadF-type ATPase
MNDLILAVDGGNAKTDVALVGRDGTVFSLVRGPGSSPHEHGVEGALDRIESLVIEAGAEGPVAHAELLLAGVDFPEEVEELQLRARERGWAERVEVANDTFAVLRAGTDRGSGVAVVCGAGINCLGLAPDGRQIRFPALGATTGDWGGGNDVGAEAVWAAARSEDGRGPATILEQVVPAHFGVATPFALAAAVHRGLISQRRFVELAPVVLEHAETDAVARSIVDRLAAEIVAFVRVALERIGPAEEAVDVLLGGGLMRARNARLLAQIEAGLGELGVPHSLRVVDAPPVVGAALRALDTIGATDTAYARLREALDADDRLAEVAHG